MNKQIDSSEDAPLKGPLSGADGPPANPSKFPHRTTIAICGLVFLVAVGCRLLALQDSRFEARKVQTAVTEGYKHTARLLREGGIRSFFSSDSPLSDPNHIGHPPGYSVLLAVAFGIFGESDSAIQLIQVLADAASALIVFFIALSLLNRTVATTAALLVALAPQFTYNSVLLLPDSIAVLPILISVLLLVRAWKRPRLGLFIAAGALIGLSCWLRANALLLPLFITAIIPILMERGSRMRYALWIIAGAVLVIAPLTIRNFIVYDHFIPVSLGAGQTLLEGIADYDADGTLGIPNTDMGIMKWEAEIDQRPDYYGMLFSPDGVQRERKRIARGLGVISSHPLWFVGVMVRRGASMLRLERVRIVSADPPVTHSIDATEWTAPVWSASTEDGRLSNSIKSQLTIRSVLDGQMLGGRGDESRKEYTLEPISLDALTDYVLRFYLVLRQGRVNLRVVGFGNEYVYASTIIETQDWKTSTEQPLQEVT
ncbi:MAG: hypothetical protein QOJ64_801, partial [Acidobacteriota bacterium]|nr:hypothetical protein [Acidobacteriota bacterium]